MIHERVEKVKLPHIPDMKRKYFSLVSYAFVCFVLVGWQGVLCTKALNMIGIQLRERVEYPGTTTE